MTYFKKLLLYAGLEKKEFESLLPDAWEENEKNLKMYSLIMSAVFLGLFLVQLFMHGTLSRNRPVYLASAAASGVLFICAKNLPRSHPQSLKVLVRVFKGILYIFSFALVFLHKDYPSVSAIVILLAMPFLFADRPAATIGINLAATAVFCVLCWQQKTPDLAALDVWNAVTYVMLAMIVTVFQMKNRFHSLFQARKIKLLSEMDLLTGAQNRNSYENKMTAYRQKSENSVGCLYADVNGLHELNNRSGHKAGDTMLKAAAEAIMNYFGAENTYRVGGDEFVAFRTDATQEDLERDSRQIFKLLSVMGYHVSIGISCMEKTGLDMTALIRDAEKDMFHQKQLYYQQLGCDRRKR